ncbi:MAG TPA: microcin ABC transporter permease [Alphaproteobacteria bacterium]|nr:microcin ABC transporter permease [Alphaproteobacteria bacterium]HAJ45155.1 microcin ABC transporter permease [Alphaproteobacteria bacterium]
MITYIVRRVLLMIPTMFGVLALTFALIQFAPGGPVERIMAQLTQPEASALGRAGGESTAVDTSADAAYRGAQGMDPALVKELEAQFGFDKPPLERFGLMLADFAVFDFGQSFYRDTQVLDLILEKLPVSITLGLWSTLIIYLVSIPLGIVKALRDGTAFDVATSAAVIIAYAVPSFLVGIGLIILFAGGSFLELFPLRGLSSPGSDDLSFFARMADYLWHAILPVTAYTLSGFAAITLLTKNCFLDEVSKQYVTTARAKGLAERDILLGHVFRNAMLVVIAQFPSVFIRVFFAGALLIETIFSLDGLGLLSFESIINRDYPVVFASVYIFSLIGLIAHLVSDILIMITDPRIDFEGRRT